MSIVFTRKEEQLIHNLAVLKTVTQQVENAKDVSDPLARAKIKDAWNLLDEAREIEERAVRKAVKGKGV